MKYLNSGLGAFLDISDYLTSTPVSTPGGTPI